LEGRFLLAEGPPLFDRLVGEPLCAGLDRFDRDLVQQAKYLRGDAARHAKDALEANRRQNARLAQRKIADDGKDELLEIVIRFPARQCDDVEASRELNVAVDRLARLRDAEADKREFGLVAQEAQRVQNDALLAQEPAIML